MLFRIKMIERSWGGRVERMMMMSDVSKNVACVIT